MSGSLFFRSVPDDVGSPALRLALPLLSRLTEIRYSPSLFLHPFLRS